MSNPRPPTAVNTLFSTLHERAKELSCLYRIEEILSIYDVALEDVFRQVIEAIPPGWQHPDCCQAQITYGSDVYESPDYEETPYTQCADIRVQEASVGRLCVSYKKPTPESDCGPFMKGEVKLLHSIAERLGHFILHQRLRGMYEQISSDERRVAAGGKQGWRIALDLLRNTNPQVLVRISRKMINYLGWRGVTEARDLLQRFSVAGVADGLFGESNLPQSRESMDRFFELTEEAFRIAAANLTDDEILDRIQRWINEDRSSSAVQSLENVYADLAEVLDSMRRIKILAPEGIQLPRSTSNSVRVALIRRFFTEQLEFINVAKKYVDLEDFFDLMERIVFPPGSHGKLGGKSAGLFVATRVLKQAARRNKIIGAVKKPKTWYVTSDGLIAFTTHNNLDEVIEQKYKDIEVIRQEYPHLVQVFKNSTFPPEVVKGLSVALDDFGEVPLIVRSSSLLEDRLGTAFAGKYKSLFLANQGDKQQRLEALLDAVAEVYASIFSPDPIQYRAERGLLDFYEEMGVMIQEVVGTRVGKYFFPAFAGVAFSKNEFRWSPRIRREDGLLRIVPGLGTRAVDRVSDYPVLVSPGQPNLRVNVSTDEAVRYSPKKIDVIDLEENSFVTKDIAEVLREVGHEFPALTKIFSIYQDGLLQRPMGLATDLARAESVVTFDGLITATPFMLQLEAILKTLSAAMGVPVDIEFASTGTDFYLLQCRPQSQAAEDVAMEIPTNLPDDHVLFTARKHVSNGRVADITHIVYIDPDRYSDLVEFADLVAVGQAVGKLNKILPRRQFILMGPGRWGSRGDIKLGVRVTYSEINNSAMLIEVARKKGNYVPDVSFGTHFFQDLVESGIRYLPLYPDDEGIRFNDKFLNGSPNKLAELCPECAGLTEALKVIDVLEATGGKVLRVVMNADLGTAVGYFSPPEAIVRPACPAGGPASREDEDQYRWRSRMAERIAYYLGAPNWGVRSVYLVDPSDGGEADPSSPIRLVIQFGGSGRQRKELETWLQGWSLSLAEMNYFRTGFHSDGLLDVQFLTDEKIRNERDVAGRVKVGADIVRQLPLGPKAV